MILCVYCPASWQLHVSMLGRICPKTTKSFPNPIIFGMDYSFIR